MEKFEIIPYRSPGLRPGFFSELGTIHDHFDGTGLPREVINLVKPLEKLGSLSKLNYVDSFVAGPERLLLPKVYKSHTPEVEGTETIDFFSSTSWRERNMFVRFLNSSEFRNFTYKSIGMVECEQVIAVLREKEENWLPKKQYIETISASEVNLIPCDTLEFEIHWGFNLPNKLVVLEHLASFLAQRGVLFGGIFLFERPNGWGYRTNAFNNQQGLRERFLFEQQVFLQFIKEEKLNCQLRGVIEKVACVYNWST